MVSPITLPTTMTRRDPNEMTAGHGEACNCEACRHVRWLMHSLAWDAFQTRIKQRVDAKKTGAYFNERWLREAREKVEQTSEQLLAQSEHANMKQ